MKFGYLSFTYTLNAPNNLFKYIKLFKTIKSIKFGVPELIIRFDVFDHSKNAAIYDVILFFILI